MGSNIREFSLGCQRFTAGIDDHVGRIHRAVALEGLRGVVLMTPVDTGRARANWQVTTDAPAVLATEKTDRSGGRAIAEGVGVIGTVKPYSVTYIANNVPYIEELEGGSSRQAPAGMLNVTFARLQRWLERPR